MNLTNEQLRELDAWIAEHVFGWERWQFDNGYPAYSHNYLSCTEKQADKYRKRGFKEGLRFLNTCPLYTTNPAAAMQVLQQCGMKVFEAIEFECSPNLFRFKLETWEDWIEAPTLPLAICKFAQKLFSK